jgi:hydroxymethylpyrimidine/phosphomethylpyrimidine kinase
MKNYITVLSIAGSDGSGGAGIQADLKTIAAAGCYGLSVITSVTAQNTEGIAGTFDLPASFVKEQFLTLAKDIGFNAVKIGMLATENTVQAVADLLIPLQGIPVVLDTVLSSSGARPLLTQRAVPAFKTRLFPLATLVTPNIPEAAVLAGLERLPETREEIEATAGKLQRQGAASVLVKGGHLQGRQCSDCLLHEGRFFWFSNARIDTFNSHGTGCTLASAIASRLARGDDMVTAVECGIAYTRMALQAGAAWKLGNGCGPLHHFPGIISPLSANDRWSSR